MVLEISLRPRLDHQLRIANATTVLRIKQLIGLKSSFLASIFPGYKTVDKPLISYSNPFLYERNTQPHFYDHCGRLARIKKCVLWNIISDCGWNSPSEDFSLLNQKSKQFSIFSFLSRLNSIAELFRGYKLTIMVFFSSVIIAFAS